MVIFEDEHVAAGCFIASFVAILLAICAGIELYRAGIQRDVYEQQGVKMSTWEVFWGAKPIDRSIREAPK